MVRFNIGDYFHVHFNLKGWHHWGFRSGLNNAHDYGGWCASLWFLDITYNSASKRNEFRAEREQEKFYDELEKNAHCTDCLIDTIGCYLCTLAATGQPSDMTNDPKRRVVGHHVGNAADPTMVYDLECGHSVI